MATACAGHRRPAFSPFDGVLPLCVGYRADEIEIEPHISRLAQGEKILVAIYRFYPLNSDGTLMGSAIRLECRDDGEAIKRAENIKGYFVELWQGERRIGRLNIKTMALQPKPVTARTP